MKLYNSIGPNPHVVRMFIAEKGLKIPMQQVDLIAGENRQADHLKRNPHGQMPALELDDGTCISEILAICEYLEDTNPEPALIGTNPKEKAETRMWTRRIDLNIVEPAANGFRYSEGLKLFQNRIRCIPQAADDLKATAREWLVKLDGMMGAKPFVTGARLTMVDVFLFAFLDFMKGIGQPLDPANKNLTAWFERMKARPSAAA